MKLAKLSLAAMVVAGLATSSFAADTLADAFKNGKVNGELRAWYFDRDTGTTSEDLFHTGVVLGYVTDSLYGLSLGATFQSNYAPAATTADKKLFDGDSYGSGAVLSEAYIAYNIGKTTAKVGRQFISTPLVSGSGSRMIKESFEGATIVNTDLPQTTLVAGYVSKFQGRTSQVTGDAGVVDGVSDIPEFTKKAVIYGAGNYTFDGAYTIAAINKSITNLTITGQYALVQDVGGVTVGDADIYVGALGYVLPVSNFKLGLDAAYQASKTDTDVNFDGDMTGFKVSLIELNGFGATASYTTTSKDDVVILGMGNGAGGAVAFTAPLIAGAAKVNTKDTDAYQIGLTYDFSKVGVAGLKALAQYTSVEAGTKDLTYMSGQIAYAIPAIKGLTVSAEYEDSKTEAPATADVDTGEFRFRANYKF